MELGGQIVPATTVVALSEELRKHAIGASASTTSVSASHESQTGVNNSARSNVITVQQVDTKTTSNPSSNFIYSSSSPSGISSSSLVNGGEDMQTVKLTHNNIDHLELGATGSKSSYSFSVPSTVNQILVVEPSRDTGDHKFGLAISLAVQTQARGLAA